MAEDDITVNLGPLPMSMAIEIIKYCVENRIDLENSSRLLLAINEVALVNNWNLTMPRHILTFFTLKYNE